MRIISGEFRGRRLNAVPGMATRPTTDKVKESLFNIIGPYFEGGTSIDLYGGSGGLSIEAVSRGIDHATLIDRQYAAIKNIEVTKHPERFSVYKQDAEKALHFLSRQTQHFDLVFLDPPYAKQHIIDDLEKMVDLNLLNDQALIVAETNQEAQLPTENWGSFEFLRQQTYGITVLTIYRFRKDEA